MLHEHGATASDLKTVRSGPNSNGPHGPHGPVLGGPNSKKPNLSHRWPPGAGPPRDGPSRDGTETVRADPNPDGP
jgi:hypothetical protein